MVVESKVQSGQGSGDGTKMRIYPEKGSQGGDLLGGKTSDQGSYILGCRFPRSQ